jgi:coenzyme F420 hydrogenase subunit beta
MEDVAPGYVRPVQKGDVPAEAERVIAEACPGAKVNAWGASDDVHPYWGPWRSINTGYATDDKVRFEGASGGAISALLIHALATGLVDRVVQVRADPRAPTQNFVATSRSREDVLAGAGSRYASSSPLANIDAILDEGGSIAFVGKPCDVSALRLLGAVDVRVARHVRLMLSFFCGGVPSRAGVQSILKALGTTEEDIVAFRYRGQGWPGSAAATTRDGQVLEMSYGESWGDYLAKEVQFRCKICPDAVGGSADISCADAWYGDERGYPSFEEQDGRSLIIPRTETGERVLREAVEVGVIALQALPISDIDLMQPAQAARKRLVRSRLSGLRVMLQPAPNVAGVKVSEAAKRASLTEQIKNAAGTVRRVLSRRR